jgi:hypothetical protein
MDAATERSFAQDAEQKVLGADVVVQQPIGSSAANCRRAWFRR